MAVHPTSSNKLLRQFGALLGLKCKVSGIFQTSEDGHGSREARRCLHQVLQEVHCAAGAEAGAGGAPQALPHHGHPGWHQQKGDCTDTAFISFITVPWAFSLECGVDFTSCGTAHTGATQKLRVKLSCCELQVIAFHYCAADN